MPSFVDIVRPVLAPSYMPAAAPRPRGKTKTADEVPTLEIVAGSVTMVDFSQTISQTDTSIYATRKERETKRTYDVARVKNADDPSQYVDVEQLKKVTINRGARSTSKNEYTVEYPGVQNGPNVEIITPNQTRTSS